jgi:hypothetical protein
VSQTDVRDTALKRDFAARGYATAQGLIGPELTAFLWSYARTKFASRTMTAKDRLVPGTPAAYADPAFEGLLEHLRPRIEALTGYALHPTYSYFRIYKKGDALARHRDRPSCEVSVSLNVGQTPAAPWPLFVEGAEGPHAANLAPGDGLLYRGCERFHWREPYAGSMLVQAFLHYVDRDGPNAGYKFDRRSSLMIPRDRDNQGD